MGWRIKLRQLEAFRGVMLSGTTKQAAALMNISQPAVSRLIQDLEEQVGMRLFERLHGRLQPKPEAQALFREAEETLAQLDRLDNSIRNVGKLSNASLRIAASPAIVYGLMPQVLTMFKKVHPKVSVSFRIRARREFREWLDAQDFDLAVSTLPIHYPSAKSEFLVRVRGVCVLPAGHPLGSKKVVHASDVGNYPFISLLPDTMARARLDQKFQDLGITRELAADAQTSSALCLLVQVGLGIGVVDPFTAERFVATGVIIKPFEPKVEYEYGIVYPIKRRKSEMATDFATLLRREVRTFKQHIIVDAGNTQ
jgi:DNA-binding transcriptional LysR family regulator